MAKTIERLQNGTTVGHVGLGMYGNQVGSVKQNVYDGDTINVRALGNFGIRFLGIDTAEKKIPLPGESQFTSLSNARWAAFLTDPFVNGGPLSPSPFPPGLTKHLKDHSGAGVAVNHKKFADTAEDELENFVQEDVDEMGVPREEFKFYLRFAYEIMDGYGRFLCYINRDQPNANVPTPRPASYNTRMLEAGLATPYFIWPNINPWRARGSILNAVLAPGTAKTTADADQKLNTARQAVKAARQGHLGIFDAADPLVIEPFEVRFLSRGQTPNRWVIDLSKNDSVLIRPENYYTIPFAEDRLFINPQHVELFVDKNWQKQP
jgi:endonuclease YncB( thermonuclease family)